MQSKNRQHIARQAEGFNELWDTYGREHAEAVKFLKTDLSSWYNGLAMTCFTVGAIAITIGSSDGSRSIITYPRFFWVGPILLLVAGIAIFFLKKVEIESDLNNTHKLVENRADMLTARNISKEQLRGNNSRNETLEQIKRKYVKENSNMVRSWSKIMWIKQIFRASASDVIFAMLLFGILLMGTQLIDVFGVPIQIYKSVLLMLLIAYGIYVLRSSYSAIQSIRNEHGARARINDELKNQQK